eukprot:GHVH01004787.1.p1 GENE.GHVH01004787.1~~GHVH01004787.1.p1  ORF type:complete len:792 (+),score=109.24 GHVH01004787.1:72-2447(+)
MMSWKTEGSQQRQSNVHCSLLLRKQSELQSDISTLKSDVEMLVFDQVGDFIETGTILRKARDLSDNLSDETVVLRSRIEGVLDETSSRFKYDGSELSLYQIRSTLLNLVGLLELPRSLKLAFHSGDILKALQIWFDKKSTLDMYKTRLPQLEKVFTFCSEYIRMIRVQSLQHHYISDGDQNWRINLSEEPPHILLESFELSIKTSSILLNGIAHDLSRDNLTDFEEIQNYEEELLVILRSTRHKIESICNAMTLYCTTSSLPVLRKLDAVLICKRVLEIVQLCMKVHKGELSCGGSPCNSYLLEDFSEFQKVFWAVFCDWFDNILLNRVLEPCLQAIAHCTGLFEDELEVAVLRNGIQLFSDKMDEVATELAGDCKRIDELKQLTSKVIRIFIVDNVFTRELASPTSLLLVLVNRTRQRLTGISSQERNVNSKYLLENITSNADYLSVISDIQSHFGVVISKVNSLARALPINLVPDDLASRTVECVDLLMNHLIDRICAECPPLLGQALKILKGSPPQDDGAALSCLIIRGKAIEGWRWLNEFPWDCLLSVNSFDCTEPINTKDSGSWASVRNSYSVFSVAWQLSSLLYRARQPDERSGLMKDFYKPEAHSHDQIQPLLNSLSRTSIFNRSISVLGSRVILDLSQYLCVSKCEEDRPVIKKVDQLRLEQMKTSDLLNAIDMKCLLSSNMMGELKGNSRKVPAFDKSITELSFTLGDRVLAYVEVHSCGDQFKSDTAEFHNIVNRLEESEVAQDPTSHCPPLTDAMTEDASFGDSDAVMQDGDDGSFSLDE